MRSYDDILKIKKKKNTRNNFSEKLMYAYELYSFSF